MSMGHWWNDTDGRKPKYSGEKPVSVPLCLPQMSYRDRRGIESEPPRDGFPLEPRHGLSRII